jgi:hypothetical protein
MENSLPKRKAIASDSKGAVKRGVATEIQEVFTCRMAPSYISQMDAAAKDRNLTRSQLVKKAIWAFIEGDLKE